MIKMKTKGDFSKANSFMERLLEVVDMGVLNKYGRAGVAALKAATPVDTGETANSWDYEIVREDGRVLIRWTNSHINEGVNIAVILQYGHGLENGSWVEGTDYINPAMRNVFEDISETIWEEVRRY